jgi:hypothetical protein
MSESFTAIEYAVLTHLRAQGRGTIPTICADLLLRPSEVETATSALVNRNVLKQEGDFFLPGECCPEVSFSGKKGDTLKLLRPVPLPMPAAAPAAAMSDVANVFRQARDKARKEKAGGL